MFVHHVVLVFEVTFVTMKLGIVPEACIVEIQFAGVVLFYVISLYCQNAY